jgi:hypothetical protein
LGGNSGRFALIKYRQKDLKSIYVLEKGLSGTPGSSGKPGLGGKSGNTAVREEITTESSRRRGGVRGWFGGREIKKDTSINHRMTEIDKTAPSGNLSTTLNSLNRMVPGQLNKHDLKTITDMHRKFFTDSSKTIKFPYFLPQGNGLSKEDVSYIQQVSTQL